MTFLDLKRGVIDASLCTNCGACVAACPQNLLKISEDVIVPQPRDEPVEQIEQACGDCNICHDVCPGRDTGSAESDKVIFGRNRTDVERWTGISQSTYRVMAKDVDVHEAASAGGATTGLLISSLESGLVDACLVIGRDEKRPWVPVPRLISTKRELIETAQASYCLTPNLQLLRDSPYKRIAVVGLACQIQAIRKWRRVDPDGPVSKIFLIIELACASNTLRSGTEHLIEDRLRLPLTDITRMRYRDGPYPGEFTVWDQEEEKHSLPFHELVLAFKEHKTFRCLSCPDWWSGLADVSVSDGDANIFKTSREGVNAGDSTHKLSLLVTRTDRGVEAVNRAASRGDLELTPGEFIPEESLGLQRKRHRYASYARRHPGDVPSAPIDGAEVDQPLEDLDVISGLSGPQ